MAGYPVPACCSGSSTASFAEEPEEEAEKQAQRETPGLAAGRHFSDTVIACTG